MFICFIVKDIIDYYMTFPFKNVNKYAALNEIKLINI